MTRQLQYLPGRLSKIGKELLLKNINPVT